MIDLNPHLCAPKSLAFCFIFLLAIGYPQPGIAETRVFYQQKVHGFAGPMAILELANEWNGRLKRGDNGFLFRQTEIGLSYRNVTVSYVKRLHAEYYMPNDAARIFYLFNRKKELKEHFKINATLKAHDYRGEGIKLTYHFGNDVISFQPHLTWLQLDTLIWGRWSGDFSYRSTKDWNLDIDVDYHYTQDKLLRRGKAPGRPLPDNDGELFSLGLNATLQWQAYRLDYLGDNLHARINWTHLPKTEAKVSTTGPFFLLGYEFEENKKFVPSKLHQLNQSLDITAQWQAISQSYLNPIRNSHSLGVAYQWPQVQLRVLRELDLNAWQAGIIHPNVSLSLMSETFNASRSRLLSAQMAFSYSF